MIHDVLVSQSRAQIGVNESLAHAPSKIATPQWAAHSEADERRRNTSQADDEDFIAVS